MKLYSQNEHYKLYNGNMLDLLKVIDKETIDAVLTDPPYELNFMGKGWDNSGIAFQPSTWQKCYEALKPGGYLLAFGGSRTFHRIACAIEDAGFEIRDTIMWLYGSGFPKSMDISKQIDKKGGDDYSKQFAIDLKQARESRNLTMKYCDDKYCNSSTNWSWYEGRKDGCRVPDYQTYLEIIKEFPELEKYRELIKEAEREVIGKKESGCFNNQEKDRYTIGSSKSLEVDITIPSTDLAKQWQGWGTALKPSFEPIIVARKPFKGSLVDNVIEYGVGGINIDECRIKTNEVLKECISSGSTGLGEMIKGHKYIPNDIGRFPANTIMTYNVNDYKEVCSGFKTKEEEYNARYFYCAKASKKDRDEGCVELEDGLLRRMRPDKDDNNPTGLNKEGRFAPVVRKNTHPTVKPTDLMQYLVRLVTPKGGTILDPFNGSGSTGKAVMYENREKNKNYKYIGIELTEEYLPIAKARIEYVCKLNEEELKEMQMTIFDILEE